MINLLILITCLLAFSIGCEEKEGRDEEGDGVDLSVEGDQVEEVPTATQVPEGGEIVDRVKQGQLADLSLYPPDVDRDQDNVPNVLVPGWDSVDNCPQVFNPVQDDSDGDGVGDACEENGNGVRQIY